MIGVRDQLNFNVGDNVYLFIYFFFFFNFNFITPDRSEQVITLVERSV